MAEENSTHDTECQSNSHTRHLCYIVSQGFHLSDKQDYEALVKDPKFKCEHCGRVANSEKNLCRPVSL
jgi:hypothetical protein